MNENAVASDATETKRPPIDSVESGSNNRVTVNFFIPEGMNPETLTLKNYRELTSKRFRMTKDQKEVRGLNRETAFVESKALAISQLGVE